VVADGTPHGCAAIRTSRIALGESVPSPMAGFIIIPKSIFMSVLPKTPGASPISLGASVVASFASKVISAADDITFPVVAVPDNIDPTSVSVVATMALQHASISIATVVDPKPVGGVVVFSATFSVHEIACIGILDDIDVSSVVAVTGAFTATVAPFVVTTAGAFNAIVESFDVTAAGAFNAIVESPSTSGMFVALGR